MSRSVDSRQVRAMLRDFGWKGRGRNWTFPDATYQVRLGFQVSKWGDEFTLNVLICTKVAWARSKYRHLWMFPRLTANVVMPGIPMPVRVGVLMGIGDKWFDLPPDAEQLSGIMRDYVMPYVERELSA